ncbi:MAG: glycoside hydrolase family 43 protein [Bacteroidales bacterium]|nr:glycoside hydrolase family 43 protein [Bacteroidales bacterium]
MKNMKLSIVILSLVFMLAEVPGFGQSKADENAMFNNPVLPGFYPDPSIIRVGEDYYMVNSSFEWFPGVPLHHSKDLVNWEQIGYVLSRASQLMLDGNVKPSEGIWAPTIRYNKGVFYLITTCQGCGGNFFVTATDPAGPWSDPLFLNDAPGIDPELFFDDDGRVYYVGCSQGKWGPPRRWPWEDRIYVQEIDLKAGKLIGEKHFLTSGHASNARWAEGPHIFRREGKYILLIGEGGTWEQHSVTAHISDSITGPFVPLHTNPVLTHRHLGSGIDITSTGHTDIVETQNGEWWAVMLGVRPVEGNYRNLGRETFLTPVKWEGTTPVFNPGIGRVLMRDRRPDLPWSPFPIAEVTDEFNDTLLQWQWNFLRTPVDKWYSLTENPGWLTINLRPENTKIIANPSLIARRQQHHKCTVFTKLKFDPESVDEVAGLVAFQNDRFHYRLEMGKGRRGSMINLYKVGSEDRNVLSETLVESKPYKGDEVVLGLKADGMAYEFFYGKDTNSMVKIADTQDGRLLTSNMAGGFIGTFIGMYASSNGATSSNKAYFDWFSYIPDN